MLIQTFCSIFPYHLSFLAQFTHWKSFSFFTWLHFPLDFNLHRKFSDNEISELEYILVLLDYIHLKYYLSFYWFTPVITRESYLAIISEVQNSLKDQSFIWKETRQGPPNNEWGLRQIWRETLFTFNKRLIYWTFLTTYVTFFTLKD